MPHHLNHQLCQWYDNREWVHDGAMGSHELTRTASCAEIRSLADAHSAQQTLLCIILFDLMAHELVWNMRR